MEGAHASFEVQTTRRMFPDEENPVPLPPSLGKGAQAQVERLAAVFQICHVLLDKRGPIKGRIAATESNKIGFKGIQVGF